LKDLHLTNGTYNAALSVFFVSYALFEPLTNVLLKKWTPRIFLTATIVVWGLCMTFMGFCTSFAGLAAARFFLGVAEAGLFPGVNYYLSWYVTHLTRSMFLILTSILSWYKRDEFGIRAAIFFSAAALAGSFGGLLAAAIAKMNGIAGKHGWYVVLLQHLRSHYRGNTNVSFLTGPGFSFLKVWSPYSSALPATGWYAYTKRTSILMIHH